MEVMDESDADSIGGRVAEVEADSLIRLTGR